MVNNIPVNGWPQLKDLEAVQPTLDRLDKIEDWKRTVKEETFTGDDITIENALALPARSLVTTINAIQDLHGYDKPWAGGAGKNKLEYPYVTASSTINGVTFTTNDDGTVIANGTATANCNFVLANKQRLDKLASGTYIMNGSPAGGAPDGSTYFLGFYAPNKSAYDFGDGTNISLSGNEDASANIYIRIANGYTANNLVFKPMIRLATETDPTFAPYSNICPISGRTAVAVDDESANKLNSSDPDYINANFDGDGNQITGNNRIATGYIEVAPSSMLKFKSSSAVAFVEFVFYTANKTFDSVEYANNASELVKTVPATAKYVRLGEQITGMGTLTPAIFTTLNQTLSSIYRTTIQLGQTVYGAEINWDTGVMTVLWASETFDGSEDETWDMFGSGSASTYAMKTTLANACICHLLLATWKRNLSRA